MRPSLRRLRKERDLTLEQLADKVDCAMSTLSNYELGRFTLGKDLLQKLAKVLDVTIEEITAPESGAPLILKEEGAPYNANVEHEILEHFPPGPAGIEKLKQAIIDLALELPDATPLMRRIGFQSMVAYGVELRKRLAQQGAPARIQDERGMPLSSKLADDVREASRRAADLAQREQDREHPESSLSERAGGKSGDEPSPRPGTGEHHKSQRSTPAPAPGSHAGGKGGGHHHNK